jgi:hypothetical protein
VSAERIERWPAVAAAGDLAPRCEHCGGDSAGVVVTKRVVTVTYERHSADCPTLGELAR